MLNRSRLREQDDVADDVAVVVAGNELLGLVGPNPLKLLMPRLVSSFSASGPSTYISVMW